MIEASLVPQKPEPWYTLFNRLKSSEMEAEAEFGEASLSALRLMREPDLPVSLHVVNQLSAGAKRRLYRILFPPEMLMRFAINPITWQGPDGDEHVGLYAPPEKGLVRLTARHAATAADPFSYLELADNGFNGIDVVLLVFSDPAGTRFDIDRSPAGESTLFGTVHRNYPAELAAMQAGLAPGQIRPGLRGSESAIQGLESFLTLLGHESVYGEPLTYVSAILFERRGFAYVHGKRLMEQIDQAFRPGGRLHQALDSSTPFRQPDQWRTVRGRAWAIHDGILATIDQRWDGLRMVKRVGHQAHLNTFPDGTY